MTSRERVLSALEHREPDQVPIDFGGHRSSGIAAMAYPRLRAALGLPPVPVRVYDPVQQLAVVDNDVLDTLEVDTIEMGRGFAQQDKDWVDWTLPDGIPCLMPAWAKPRRGNGEWLLASESGRTLGRMPDGADFFDQVYWPFQTADDLSHLRPAFAASMWMAFPSPPGPLAADTAALAAGAKLLRQSSERAIIFLFGGNLLEAGALLYGMERFLMLLASDPVRVHQFLDRLVELHLEQLDRMMAAVGSYVDIVLFGDDLGTQTGPILSPSMYREFFKPRHAFLWKRAKKLAPVKVMLHCCGAVRPLMRDLIEAGIDAINPVQIAARGMEAEGLKRDFGRDITFWGGGCDTQSVLAGAPPDAVAAHVHTQVRTLAPGGGFVFQPVHNILADVPAENVVTMFRAVRERAQFA